VEVRVNATDALYDEIYSPEVVMARVGCLDRGKRQDIEHITRIIRASFNPGGILRPRPRIKRIMLVGEYAQLNRDEDEEATAVAPYRFWIVVNDRLFTRKRLWQATRAQIRRELGKACHVRLSVSSTGAVRTGRANEDSFILERLNTGITLYRSRHDEPPRRRPRDYWRQWSEALNRYRHADAAFGPVQAAFDAAERAWFAARSQRDRMSAEALQQLRNQIGVDKAYDDERRYGDAREATIGALLNTPAPDLATVIRKLELILETHFDKDIEKLILADLRRLHGGAMGEGRAAS
jgi:hypothetical protein